jgi:hypothetical protein
MLTILSIYLGLEKDLLEASLLSTDSLYENSPGAKEDSILGKGT